MEPLLLGLVTSMFVLTVAVGIAPVQLLKLLRKKAALATVDPLSGRPRSLFSLILSLLSCFSGGVFMGTCFLHLLPELNDRLKHIESTHDIHPDYPIGELVGCIGFFLLFFFEELVLLLFPSLDHEHHHHGGGGGGGGGGSGKGQEQQLLSAVTVASPAGNGAESTPSWAAPPPVEMLSEPERCETNCMRIKEHHPPILMKRRPHPHSHGIRSFTFVMAISFHSLIEGMALGVQKETGQVWTLFISLLVHKLIVAFSVGLQLARTHAHALRWVCFSIVVFALMTPMGALGGSLVHSVPMDELLQDWLVVGLQGLSVGTFIYVTFFEILIHERDNEHSSMMKLLFIVLGFTLIGVMRLLSDGHSHGEGHDGHNNQSTHGHSTHGH